MNSRLLRQIRDCAANAECDVVDVTQNKHLKVTVRRGDRTGVVYMSLTPSDVRAWRNIERDMRRVTE